MTMKNEKPSFCEKVAELGRHRKECRIRVVANFRVLSPNTGRSAAPLEAVLSQAKGEESKDADRLDRAVLPAFRPGDADGGTRFDRIIETGRTALTALFLRRHCGTEVSRNDQLRCQRAVLDVNLAQNGTFLRWEFGI